MRKVLFSGVIAFIIGLGVNSPAKAASEAECAIWLCLPSGFPSGCGEAKSAWKKRVKKGKPPLPDYSACTGEGGGNGRYSLGTEYFEECEPGFKRNNNPFGNQSGLCIANDCRRDNFNPSDFIPCNHYTAARRPKPTFVEIWVDEQYQGKYFY